MTPTGSFPVNGYPILTSEDNPWDYKMNTISPVKRARVLELRQGGKTLKVIASEVGLHEMTVGKILLAVP